MTRKEINKRLCELLDICKVCAFGNRRKCECFYEFQSPAGMIDLLWRMKAACNIQEFLDSLQIIPKNPILGMINVDYLFNKTGLLAKAALEFLEERK